MNTLVNCPKCKAEIESDSHYCDQCGIELYICPQCHLFGKGKRCTQCGQALEPVKAISAKASSNLVTPPGHLVCHIINANLQLINGAIIGRRTGDYVSTFASQRYVSGTHARLQINSFGKWEIVDLDSSNGTFINGVRLSPHIPAIFNVDDVVRIAAIDFKAVP